MRYWWITGVAGGAVLFGGLVYFQHFRSATPSPTRGSQAALAENGYVDPVTCAGCHRNIAKTYKLTGMSRSFYRPTRLNTLGESSKAATFYHKASDSYFAVLEHNGRFYQRRYRVGFDRRQTNVLEKEVDFVMGSGNHVRSYLYRTPRNTLVELPLAWYSENGGYWAMNPGYDRPDHQGFRREITYACMFCHNGIPEVPRGSDEPGAVPEFSGRLPEGIDCQRCHGPGRRHVEAARASGGKVDDISKAIVNPARLSADREMEVCMQCHLETTSLQLPNAIVRYGQGPLSYVPGEPLANFMLQFDQARGNDRFEIASSAYRLRRSKCFLKSEGSLRCTTCHNPHDIPRGQEAAQHYTQVCRQCHQPAIQRLVASGKHTQSADCLGCHMPKRRTEDVVHVVMTDHYIQRRKPAGDLLAPIPEHRETEANAYRGAVVPYYPSNLENTAEGELYLAMAQVSQKSNLKEGIPRLVAAIEKDHPDRIEFYIQLADALAADSKLERAIPIYEDTVRREPRSFAALRKLATALRDSGQFARSAEVLKKTLDVLPANAAAWHELGLSYLNQGLKTEAIAAFQKAIGLDPDAPEPYNSLGGVSLEARELSKAEGTAGSDSVDRADREKPVMSCRFCALLVVVAIAPFAALAQQPGTSPKPGISGSLTSTAPAMPADALQVLDLERKIGEAIVRGDTAFYDRVTAEDFVMTHSDRWTTGGIPLLVDNKASFQKRIENRSHLTYDLDSVKIEMHGDIAITYGRYVASMRNTPAERVWFSVWFEKVYAKRNGQWMYLSHRTVRGANYGPDRASVADK